MNADTGFLQDLIGYMISGVNNDFTRGDGKGIGTIVPLFPGGVDDAVAAAADQLNIIEFQMLFQNIRQRSVFKANADLALFPLDNEHINIFEDIGMDREFVMIHHGEHRIKMHKSTLFWYIESQNFLKITLFGKEIFGEFFNGAFMGALGNPNGYRGPVEDQDIAAFQRGIFFSIIPYFCIFIKGVMGKNVISENRFPSACLRKHFMDGHAVPYRSEGISRKIKVGHGIHHKGIITAHMADKVAQCVSLKLFHIGFTHPRHHPVDHVSRGKGGKIFGHDLRFPCGGEIRLLQHIVNKALLCFFIHNGLFHQIFQINDFGAVLSEQGGKSVVLLSGDF